MNTTPHLTMRYTSAAKALAGAKRLSAKYGPHYAVVFMPDHPVLGPAYEPANYGVVCHPDTPAAVMGPK